MSHAAHDRPEQSTHPAAAPALDREQRDQHPGGDRHDTAEGRGRDLNPLDRTQDCTRVPLRGSLRHLPVHPRGIALQQLMPELEQIRCEREQILMDADSSLDHVFFLDSGVVSAVAVYAAGSIIEMATIGREGCTSVQAVFGAKISSVRLLVQIPGGAASMSRAAAKRSPSPMISTNRVTL